MDKYCKFLKSIYDDKELIWEKDEEYLITYENKETYYFGKPLINGISKNYENEKFIIVEK